MLDYATPFCFNHTTYTSVTQPIVFQSILHAEQETKLNIVRFLCELQLLSFPYETFK